MSARSRAPTWRSPNRGSPPAQSQVLTAEANLKTSQATYRRVIGVEPGKLRAGMPVDRFSPRSLEAAIAQGRGEHPR